MTTALAKRNEVIVRLHEEGIPHRLIAAKVGASETAVSSYLDDLRRRVGEEVSLHRLGGGVGEREARRHQIVAWRAEGLSNHDIAKKLGTSAASVSGMMGRCRRLGLMPASGRRRSVDDLKRALAEGLSYSEVAEQLGYPSRNAVAAHVKRLRQAGYELPAVRRGRRSVKAQQVVGA